MSEGPVDGDPRPSLWRVGSALSLVATLAAVAGVPNNPTPFSVHFLVSSYSLYFMRQRLLRHTSGKSPAILGVPTMPQQCFTPFHYLLRNHRGSFAQSYIAFVQFPLRILLLRKHRAG